MTWLRELRRTGRRKSARRPAEPTLRSVEPLIVPARAGLPCGR
jgi:hypothetical protein